MVVVFSREVGVADVPLFGFLLLFWGNLEVFAAEPLRFLPAARGALVGKAAAARLGV